MRTYLVEPQKIFVPAISAILLEAGLEIVRIAYKLDFRDLVETVPRVVFVDIDFLESEAKPSIQLIRVLLPDGIICIYTSYGHAQSEYRACGADGVFAKASPRRELIQGIRNVIFLSNGSRVK